jgi:hypothetical protein
MSVFTGFCQTVNLLWTLLANLLEHLVGGVSPP